MLADAHAVNVAGVPPVVCTLLLVLTVVLFIVGLTEALGVTRFTGSRYGAIVAFAVALVLYIVLC